MSRHALDLRKCLAILVAIDKRPQTVPELVQATGYSRPTVYRLLDDLRQQLGVGLSSEGDYRVTYRVTDWGVLDRGRAIRTYRGA